MSTKPSSETYTVTKYDSAKQDGYKRSNPPHYWFDVQDGNKASWLIMGATHAESAPANAEAQIDEIEFTRVPIEQSKALELGSIVLRAAAKDFQANGAEKLSMQEPMVSNIKHWENAFGADNLVYNPPVETSCTDPDLYLDTVMSVDLTNLDMNDWPAAHIYGEPAK